MKDKEREREGGTERERVKKKKLLVYFSSWNCIPMCSNMVQNLLRYFLAQFKSKSDLNACVNLTHMLLEQGTR